MPNYTDAELLSESAKVFRAQIEPVKEGGTLNTRDEYAQLLEMAGITFLLNPDAIFYLAFLVRNRLLKSVNSEIDLLEDMLVLLDELGQQGTPVTDTSSISNAKTALLALDAAQSLKNRPELARFMKTMDKFAENYRKNVVSPTVTLSRPKEDARNLLKENLARLKDVHDTVLRVLASLRDLLQTFEALDLPSAVSATTLTSVRTGLDEISGILENSSVADNIADSRYVLLKTLSSKVAVNVLSTFKNPSQVKLRTPINPIPETLKHYGRVTGSGDKPFVETNPGPWEVNFDADNITFGFKSSSVSVPLATVKGSVLNGRIDGPFNIVAGVNDELHIVVDQNQYSGAVTLTGLTVATFGTSVPLRFKHLGSTVCFSSATTFASSDYYPRAVTELRLLQSFTISSYVPTTKILTGVGVTFTAEDVGNYIKYGATYRVEILEFLSATQVLVEVVPGEPTPSGAATLHGYRSVSTTEVTFAPSLSAPITSPSAVIGPTAKTARFTAGSRTLAGLISDIELLQGDYPVSAPYAALSYHVEASVVAGFPNRISLRSRSWSDPQIHVSNIFLSANGPSTAVVMHSVHEILGFRLGELGTSRVLTTTELTNLLNGDSSFSGAATAAFVVDEVASGTSLQSTNGTSTLSDSTVSDWGAKPGDQIKVLNGINACGVYRIATASSSSLTVRDKTFVGNETGLRYRIFREVVRVTTLTGQRGDYIEVTEAPSSLGFTSERAYASIPFFEAVDKVGSLLSFSGIAAGDFLKIVGVSDPVRIASVSGTQLELDVGLPSNIEKAVFSILGACSDTYSDMSGQISTLLSSKQMLGRYGFSKNLDALDAALTTAMLPGQGFVATRNQAIRLIADLLSVFTDSPRRSSEYTASVPHITGVTVEEALSTYTATSVPPLDRMIDAFVDRKYTRATYLLLDGQLAEFFHSNEETGSYGGAILYHSRKVALDLPNVPSSASVVEDEVGLATGTNSTTDGEFDFSDTVGQDLSES
jgi:hypothetical protein